MFIDQLQSSALQDCAAFYESDIDMLLSEYENSAVNETELLVGTNLWLCVRLCVCACACARSLAVCDARFCSCYQARTQDF